MYTFFQLPRITFDNKNKIKRFCNTNALLKTKYNSIYLSILHELLLKLYSHGGIVPILS